MIDTNDIILSKLEIAEHQLEKALQLFLDDSEYICAITLAGASEEILGKLREKQGDESNLNNFVNTSMEIYRRSYNEDIDKKEFVRIANHFRNELKHYAEGKPIGVGREAAIEMIDRAISNYFALTGKETDRMQRFTRETRLA